MLHILQLWSAASGGTMTVYWKGCQHYVHRILSLETSTAPPPNSKFSGAAPVVSLNIYKPCLDQAPTIFSTVVCSPRRTVIMAGIRLLVLPALLVAIIEVSCVSKLQEQFSWTILDFAYSNDQERQRAIQTKRFIPENNLPVGIEVWNDKLFVSVPRWRPGIPATLNYIPLYETTPQSPALIPYPSWESNELANCEHGLTTVYRIKADACDRLWVLDTGTYGIGNTTTNPCPYAINVFDLHTNQRLRRYEFRAEDTNPDTFIANIAVDLGKSCDDAFAYFSDELGYGLIVYSWEQNKSWRFEHSYFMPDPLTGDFNIGGLNFQWGEEGIFGITLSPVQKNGYRTLFFNPLASHREFAVSTEILRNSSRTEDSYHDFQVMEERGDKGHVTSSFMDEDGLMFFNMIDRNGVGCWNSEKPYTAKNHAMVDMDEERMIFPSDVKVDKDRNVWVISDRMPNFLLSNLDFKDVNFRIFFAPVDVLIKGTVCELKQGKISTYVRNIPVPQHPHLLQHHQYVLGQNQQYQTLAPVTSYQTYRSVPAYDEPKYTSTRFLSEPNSADSSPFQSWYNNFDWDN